MSLKPLQSNNYSGEYLGENFWMYLLTNTTFQVFP